jgi:hypothetical protein
MWQTLRHDTPTAATNGEYFVGVFSGENGRFLYKVKKKFLKQLGD